ncbi:MAG: adenylate/guanylate cyclase domain-containing protein, partial [Acidobacteriota bacterium]
EGLPIDGNSKVPSYAQSLVDQGMESISILPLFVKDRLAGMLSLGHRKALMRTEEELVRERQVADQVAVALSNAQLTQEQEKLMGMFERYVSPEAASEIWRRREEITLGGEEKTATVLFSDIRDFSTRWAGQPSQEALSWLNHYLTAMSDIVMKHGGFVNKFMGDGVMVLFGVPLSKSVSDEARSAVDSAMDMLAWVEQNNEEREEGEESLRIGIGIHTGILTAGNVGAANRLEYSVIGENVNMAARLEELTKRFPVDVILSEATHQLVEGHVETEPLAEVVIRGFTGKSKLYTVNRKSDRNAVARESASVSTGGVV